MRSWRKEWGTEVSWQWYDQDGNLISDNDTYSGAETDTLIVTADKAMDGKGYYCVRSDDYRTAQTDVSNMIVEEETTDPEEPGQNPGGGTQTPENPGSGTENARKTRKRNRNAGEPGKWNTDTVKSRNRSRDSGGISEWTDRKYVRCRKCRWKSERGEYSGS